MLGPDIQGTRSRHQINERVQLQIMKKSSSKAAECGERREQNGTRACIQQAALSYGEVKMEPVTENIGYTDVKNLALWCVATLLGC